MPARADGPGVIASMDTPRFQPPPKGTARLVPGRTGQSLAFHFDKNSKGAFATSNIHGTPDWDRAAGFSFWVKGDGTDQLAGLEFIFDEDYAVRYDYAFPVKGTDWRQVIVAWDDLIPVLPGPKARPLGGKDGNPPSKLSADCGSGGGGTGPTTPPRASRSTTSASSRRSIAGGHGSYRPAGDPLTRVRRKLKAGQRVTIVTMGDSLTDKRHWANREVAWVDLLRDELKDRYHADVTIVNPAIGGTQLRQNVILVPRWLAHTHEPDLVTIFFGGNDWDSGMRGEEFTRACEDVVDRVRRATGGNADVLLITTNPAATRWTETAELAESCRRASRSRNCGLADTERAFHDDGLGDRDHLYVDDRVHLSRAGHEVVAAAVMQAIDGSR